MSTIERYNGDQEADWLFVKQPCEPAEPDCLPYEEIVKRINGETVCIAAPSSAAGIRDLLSKLSESRVYMVLSSEDNINQLRSANHIIRIIDRPQTGALLITANRAKDRFTAWIFPNREMRYGYNVPAERARTKFHEFAKLFWTCATKEYRGTLEPSEALPFPGTAAYETSDSWSLEGPASSEYFAHAKRAYLRDVSCLEQLPDDSEYKVITFARSGLSGNIKEICDRKNIRYTEEMRISESDGGGFSLIITAEGGMLLPGKFTATGVNWSCLLSDSAAQRFAKGFGRDWILRKNLYIKDLIGRSVRSVEAPYNEDTITSTGTSFATVQCKGLQSFLDGNYPRTDDTVTYGRSFSCSTEYQLRFLAPLLPEGATLNENYEKWRAKENEWSVALDKVKSLFTDNLEKLKASTTEYEYQSIMKKSQHMCQMVEQLREDAAKIKSLDEEQRDELYRRYRDLDRRANYFRRECYQYIKLDPVRRSKVDDYNNKGNSIIGVACRGIKTFVRVFIDKFQDLLSRAGVDTNRLLKVKFHEPLPDADLGLLYEYAGRCYFALPHDAPRERYSDERVLEVCDKYHAILCRQHPPQQNR